MSTIYLYHENKWIKSKWNINLKRGELAYNSYAWLWEGIESNRPKIENHMLLFTSTISSQHQTRSWLPVTGGGVPIKAFTPSPALLKI